MQKSFSRKVLKSDKQITHYFPMCDISVQLNLYNGHCGLPWSVLIFLRVSFLISFTINQKVSTSNMTVLNIHIISKLTFWFPQRMTASEESVFKKANLAVFSCFVLMFINDQRSKFQHLIMVSFQLDQNLMLHRQISRVYTSKTNHQN